MKLILILLFFILPFRVVSSELTRGVRNNNPGNIRPNDWKNWPKATGLDDQGHLVFKKPIDGIRAIVINLKLYKKNHNIKTIKGIINRWIDEVPAEERKPYIDFMAERLDVSEHAHLNFYDPLTLKLLTKAIIFYENGYDPYPEKLYKMIFPHT